MCDTAPTRLPATLSVDHKNATKGTVMKLEQEIAAIRSHVAKAEADRDAWRAAGLQEKYLEACGLVDMLERQLDECLRQLGHG
jgi:electron transfer flavoprotein alpha/beta subunit